MLQKMGKVQGPVGSGLSQEEVVEEENVSEAGVRAKALMFGHHTLDRLVSKKR